MNDYIQKHKTELIYVVVITIFAFILRLVAIHNFGDLWVDELYSFYFANRQNPLLICKTLFMEDFHVPLYFVLLHYWMKIFGQSDFILRLMGCIITTMSVPIGFYVCKNLFNKFTAYFVSLFLAVNALNIHYSCELRFYGMTIVLALLSCYIFVKAFENRKFVIAYIVTSIILLYTYNFSFMFVFCQFLVGLVYLLKVDKTKIKTFLLSYIIIGIVYLPVIFFVLKNVLLYKTALLNFVRDIFGFDLMFFYTFMMTAFSNLFDQFMTNDIMVDFYIFKHLFTPKFFIFTLIPVLFGIIGCIKAFISKNKNLLLFSFPAILFFIVQVVLVLTHNLALILRYTVITSTILMIVSIYGWSLFKVKKTILCIMFLWFIINCFTYGYFKDNSINRNIIYSRNLVKELEVIDIKDNDIVFIPRFSKLLTKYIKNGKIANFDSYDALLLGIRPQDIEFIFGKEYAEKLNRKMLKTYLYDYITTPISSKLLFDNLNSKYYSKMNKGDRFIIISDEFSYLQQLSEIQNFMRPINVYTASAVYYPLSAKIVQNVSQSAQKDLKIIKTKRIDELFGYIVFEKN